MDIDDNEPPPPVDMEESDDEGDAMPGLLPWSISRDVAGGLCNLNSWEAWDYQSFQG
jgi:hypothetical protein